MIRKALLGVICSSIIISLKGAVPLADVVNTPSNTVNVTVPSSLNLVFNSDGSNSLDSLSIGNESLVPITIGNISASLYNDWRLVPSDSIISKDTKELSFTIEGKDLASGDNSYSIEIGSKSEKDLGVMIKRGAWSNSISEKALDLAINYDIGKSDFTLSFDSSGGSDIENISAKNGDTIVLPTPSKVGYTFLGWKSSSGVVYDGGSSYVMPIGGDELVAQWRVNKLYIQFHMNGGSLSDKVGSGISAKGDLITYKGSTSVSIFDYGDTLPSTGLVNWNNENNINIWKTGYIASKGAEWSITSDGTGKTFDQTVVYKVSDLADLSNGDVTLTLYVNWKPIKYTINFYGNWSDGGSTASMNVDYDTSKSLTKNRFTKQGYSFSKWNFNEFGTSTSYSDEQVISNLSSIDSGVVSLYAQWKPNAYSVNINPNNDVSSPSSFNDTIGRFYDLESVQKVGYDFSGWSKNENSLGLFGKKHYSDSLYAPAVYNNKDNGSVTIESLPGSYQDYPYYTSNIYKITSTGDAYPGYGGFIDFINSSPNKVYIHTFMAKLPKGTMISDFRNPIGNGGYSEWLTTKYGTGEWQWYAYKVVCGDSGNFSSFGHIAVEKLDNLLTKEPSAAEPLVWYIGHHNMIDVTDQDSVTNDCFINLGSDDVLTAKWTPKKYKVNFDENYIENNLYDTFYDLGYWDFNSTIDSSNSSFAIKEDNSLDSGKYVEISLGTPVGDNFVGGYYYGGDKLEAGKTYTWMINIKASTEGILSQIGDEQNGVLYDIGIDTEWKTIRHTFTAQNTPHGSFTFYYEPTGSFQQGDKIYVSNLQLMEGSPSVLTEIKDYGSNLGTLPIPTRGGYTFLGWYTGVNSGDKTGSDAIVSVDNSTYYARWSPNSDTKYVVNHYQMNLDGSTYSLVETENLRGVSNNNLSLDSLKKSYTGFTYENGKVNNKVVSSVNISPDGGTVIDLYYSRNKVVLDINAIVGGTVYGVGTPYMSYDLTVNGVKVQTQEGDGYDLVYYGSEYEVSNINAKLGYSYVGVKTGVIESQGNGYDLKGVVTDTSRHGVFIVLDKNLYPITYDLDGGSIVGQKDSYTVDTETFTLPIPTKEGYTFLGWTGSNGSVPQTSAAIDKGSIGSKSFKANWSINTYSSRIFHWIWGMKNGEGNNESKRAFLLKSVPYDFLYGDGFYLDSSYAVAIPNGFKLRNTFGTKAISGLWEDYPLGTLVHQKSYTMDFEYDYDPIEYNITYNLDGGINSPLNPNTYNVLYGVTLEPPIKEGYTFDGWYIGDEKVEGINIGANANFSNTEDIYNELASRTTGDITLKAKWNINNYYLDVDGVVDNEYIPSLKNYHVLFDVYINDSLYASDISGICIKFPYNTKYEIRNIRPVNTLVFNGVIEWNEKDKVYKGLSGNIPSGSTKVVLSLSSN